MNRVAGSADHSSAAVDDDDGYPLLHHKQRMRADYLLRRRAKTF